ncbi:YraN family protein [Thiocapsa sp.]|uniref:YraN family protein n=1 Tax=Thiocapsa sp. TaxID=2024551 RepID=UPI002BE2BA99|nr:YraN family protein [Thiocapsa sp.]HSO81418.1 YraN family protein [Thiocapsa sp.]
MSGDTRRPSSATTDATVGTRDVGDTKERLAEDYLKRRHLQPIARNHRCRFGEIDLVMRDGATLVFVEVRYRRSERFGTPAETVDRRKQQRLTAAASHYLQAHPTMLPCRFDVVAVSGEDRIEWIKNAFSVES